MRKVTILMGIIFLGCMGPGYDSGWWESGGSGGFSVSGAAYCDPNASAFDDVWYAVAVTSAQATSVQVQVASQIHALEYFPEYDQWEAQIWADDLSSDCDSLSALTWTFTATGQNGETANYGPVTGQLYQ